MERLSVAGVAGYSAIEASIHVGRYAPILPICPGRKVLDLACGEGYGSWLLRKAGAVVVDGVDVSREAISEARRLFELPGLNFHEIAGEELTTCLPKAFYDLIACIETIEHVAEPRLLLRELKKVAAPGCVIYVTCPNDHWYYQDNVSNPFHVRKYRFEEFRAIAEPELGRDVRWLIGTAAQGFTTTPVRPKRGRRNGGAKSPYVAVEPLASALLCEPNEAEEVAPGTSSYFVGVWNDPEGAVGGGAFFPMSMTSYARKEDSVAEVQRLARLVATAEDHKCKAAEAGSLLDEARAGIVRAEAARSEAEASLAGAQATAERAETALAEAQKVREWEAEEARAVAERAEAKRSEAEAALAEAERLHRREADDAKAALRDAKTGADRAETARSGAEAALVEAERLRERDAESSKAALAEVKARAERAEAARSETEAALAEVRSILELARSGEARAEAALAEARRNVRAGVEAARALRVQAAALRTENDIMAASVAATRDEARRALAKEDERRRVAEEALLEEIRTIRAVKDGEIEGLKRSLEESEAAMAASVAASADALAEARRDLQMRSEAARALRVQAAALRTENDIMAASVAATREEARRALAKEEERRRVAEEALLKEIRTIRAVKDGEIEGLTRYVRQLMEQVGEARRVNAAVAAATVAAESARLRLDAMRLRVQPAEAFVTATRRRLAGRRRSPWRGLRLMGQLQAALHIHDVAAERLSGWSEEAHELERRRELVLRSGLYDEAFYLRFNPDIATFGLDPLTHFVEHGGREGRSPGPNFYAAGYLEAHSDVAEAGENPLVHFCDFGATEGRAYFPFPADAVPPPPVVEDVR